MKQAKQQNPSSSNSVKVDNSSVCSVKADKGPLSNSQQEVVSEQGKLTKEESKDKKPGDADFHLCPVCGGRTRCRLLCSKCRMIAEKQYEQVHSALASSAPIKEVVNNVVEAVAEVENGDKDEVVVEEKDEEEKEIVPLSLPHKHPTINPIPSLTATTTLVGFIDYFISSMRSDLLIETHQSPGVINTSSTTILESMPPIIKPDVEVIRERTSIFVPALDGELAGVSVMLKQLRSWQLSHYLVILAMILLLLLGSLYTTLWYIPICSTQTLFQNIINSQTPFIDITSLIYDGWNEHQDLYCTYRLQLGWEFYCVCVLIIFVFNLFWFLVVFQARESYLKYSLYHMYVSFLSMGRTLPDMQVHFPDVCISLDVVCREERTKWGVKPTKFFWHSMELLNTRGVINTALTQTSMQQCLKNLTNTTDMPPSLKLALSLCVDDVVRMYADCGFVSKN